MNSNLERFTGRARKVLLLAEAAAAEFQQPTIGTEHILLGILREGGGISGRILLDLGLDIAQVESTIDELWQGMERLPSHGTAELAPQTKQMLQLAVEEAQGRKHPYIGTEHLLLGLIAQENCMAVTILKRFDIHPEQVRQSIQQILQESVIQRSESKANEVFMRFGISPDEVRRQTRRILQERAVRKSDLDPQIPSAPPPAMPDSPYTLMQTIIMKLLAMVENKSLTVNQASELFSALAPQLKLSIIEQTELISQLFQLKKLQKYKVHFTVTDLSGKEAPGETTLLLTRLLKEIDDFLAIVVNTPDIPLIYTQDEFRLEVRIEKDEGQHDE